MIAFWGVGGRSLFWDVGSAIAFLGMWRGAIAVWNVRGRSLLGDVGMGDRFDNEDFGGAIAFGVWECDRFLGM